MSSKPDPRIVVLNGGSSSGKSSITRALQGLASGTWLTFGVDAFIDALPGRGDSPQAGITFEPDGTITFSPVYRTLEQTWYTGLASMAKSGAHILLDEVPLSGGIRQDCAHDIARWLSASDPRGERWRGDVRSLH